ncbi:hypothetical protein SAMN05443669_101738 [Flavobacterium xanthum]|uniref:Uncharacterized protein n=1 Tax=Flavobacterium xanthum TaxID=69322 RepID=A0A1M7EJ51_9FLAO|nr:hypothetical protein SAMN05443669_101738 [Flavobacterium xanthum]
MLYEWLFLITVFYHVKMEIVLLEFFFLILRLNEFNLFQIYE